MISIVYNETQKAIEIHLDNKGVDLLIMKLERLKSLGGHIHVYPTDDDNGLSVKSPYAEKTIYTELILNLLPADSWDAP